jgi:tetratricopeptide (TPR) repeat protein
LVQHKVAELLREQKRAHILESLDKSGVIFQRSPEEGDVSFDQTVEHWDRIALEHDRIMLRMSNRPYVAKLVGDYLMQAKLSPEAVAAYRKASDDNPPDDELLTLYAEAAIAAKNNEALGDALWKAWRLRPLDDQRLNRLLEVARGAGLNDLLAKAVGQLEHDNPLDPRVAQYRLAMAIDQADPKAVTTQLNRYKKSGGNDPRVIKTALQSAARFMPKRAEK